MKRLLSTRNPNSRKSRILAMYTSCIDAKYANYSERHDHEYDLLREKRTYSS